MAECCKQQSVRESIGKSTMGSNRGMLEGRKLEAHQWRGCPGRSAWQCASCRSCNPSVTRAASSASGTRVWSPSTTPCQWWTGASCPRPYEAPRACPSPTGLSACTRSDAYRALQCRGNRSRCSRRVSRSTGKRLCHSRHRRRSNAHLVAEWDWLGAKGGLAGKGGSMMQGSPAKLSPTSLRSFARDLSIAGCIFAVSGSQSSPGIMVICSGAQPCCRPSESAAVSPPRACRRVFFCVIACASSLCTGERAGWPGYGKGSGSVTRPTHRQPDWIREWMARIWEGMDSGRRPYLDEGPEFLGRSRCERRAGLARSRVQVPMPTPSQSTANCGASFQRLFA